MAALQSQAARDPPICAGSPASAIIDEKMQSWMFCVTVGGRFTHK
jgi:hypothetical protein